MARRPKRLKSGSLHELVFLSDPQLSADGGRAVAVRTRIETPEEGPPRYRSEVVEVPLDGALAGEPRVLAGGERDARHPRLSPDGRFLAFLATPVGDGTATAQVRLLDLERGGESRALTSLKGGVSAFAWRPDGAALVAIGRDEAPPSDPGDVVAREVTRLHAKQDGVPVPGLRPEAPARAVFVDVEKERVRDLPSPDDGVTDAIWGRDGRTVWLLGPRDVDEGDAWRTTLWSLSLTKRGKVRRDLRAACGPLTSAGGLSLTADGRTVAFLAPSDPDDFASPTGLWTVDAAGGDAALRSDPDVAMAPSVGGDARYGAYPNRPVGVPGGWLLNVNREGASGPAVLHDDGRITARLEGAQVVTSFAHAGGRTLCLVETPRTPGALVLIDRDGAVATLYDPNADFVGRYALPAAEGPFHLTAGSGSVAWWRLSPTTPRDDHAVVVQVHGGPHTNAGFGFSFEHQLLAARGYTVVFANPRGSSSYGAEHAATLLGRYGTIDADDVLAVVDHALAGHADPQAPVHLTGGSYGGFMTNWLVGRTDRFRSAVTQRSICNWLSFYGTSDIGYRFAEHEVQGTPWEDLHALWDQSPLKNVAQVRTPILIVHAEADHRCPVEQAEQWFVALARIGAVDTKLVRFPGESHELSRSGRPDRRVRRLDEIVGWFEGHA